MKVTVSQAEITAGLIALLNSRGFNLNPQTTQVHYTQGRKGAGLTAEIVEGDVAGQAPLEPRQGVTVKPPVEKPAETVNDAKSQLGKEDVKQPEPETPAAMAPTPTAADAVAAQQAQPVDVAPEQAQATETKAPAATAENEGGSLFS